MINLFTVPPQPAPSSDGPSDVVAAIREGSGTSGADFDYLLKTAARESAFNPDAKASTSSASGLFQFVEQTWLRMIRQYGGSVGLQTEARAVSEDRNGRLDIADRALKSAVLDLRHDPKLASVMAGYLTRENAADLSASLGRKVSMEELYIAHVLGSSGASDLIRLSASDPDRPAAPLFSDAARANPALFFDRSRGQAKSLAEVRGGLADAFLKSRADFMAFVPADDTYVDVPVEIKTDASKSLYSLFQNRSDVAPLNSYVRDLWQTPDAAGAPVVPSYFPASAAAVSAYRQSALPPLPDERADVPLPPQRAALPMPH